MPRVLKCGDVMPGCTTVLEGLDDADVIRRAVEHAKTTHKMATMPFDVTNKVKAAIKNKQPASLSALPRRGAFLGTPAWGGRGNAAALTATVSP